MAPHYVDTPINPVLVQFRYYLFCTCTGFFRLLRKENNMGQIQDGASKRLLRLKDVLKLLPICKSSWWAGVKSGKYPASMKLGARTTVWKEQDVIALIDNLSATTH